MLSEWLSEVVGARGVASELRAYLVGMVGRIDSRGWLHVSAADALEDARRVGRHRRGPAMVGDGAFQCACGDAHRLDGAAIECGCGTRYVVEWTGDGCRVMLA